MLYLQGSEESGAMVFSMPIEPKSLAERLWWAWDEAQGAAELAYWDWTHAGGRDAYFAYRAAQDRADAAQDALAGDWQSAPQHG